MSRSTDRIGVDEIPLECWPLVHGSLRLAQTKDVIRRDGLHPPAQGGQRALNSLSLDVSLKRTDYVFLAPARIRGGYGAGWFVVVDPIALNRDDVKYSLHDIGLIYPFILYACSTGHIDLPEYVPSRDQLLRVLENALVESEQSCRDGESDEVADSIYRRSDFREWAEKSLYIDRQTFWRELKHHADDLGMQPRDFLSRAHDGRWKYEEEILIPRVEPSEVVGCYVAGRWNAWNAPVLVETRVVLDYMLALLQQDASKGEPGPANPSLFGGN